MAYVVTPPGDAFDALLPVEERTGDTAADYTEAVRRALLRREQNKQHGGAMIRALRDLGFSWREIETRTGIPQGTARRWAEPTPAE